MEPGRSLLAYTAHRMTSEIRQISAAFASLPERSHHSVRFKFHTVALSRKVCNVVSVVCSSQYQVRLLLDTDVLV